MAARTVTLNKTADMKLGVRLSGSRGGKVKIVEINPQGLLAGKVTKNEVLLSINGTPCSAGHGQAAEMLKTATGQLVLEIAAKRPSLAQRLTGSKPSVPTQQPSFTSLDTPTPEPATGPPPAAVPPPAESTVVAAQSPPPVAAVAETKGDPTATMPAAVQPVVRAPVPAEPKPAEEPKPTGATGEPAAPPTQPQLAPDEYTVVLQRNKTASIGMRLVQKKHTDLPFIQDIDPAGPAAKTNIVKGDILLEVNGVDARASHDELKKALGTTDAAVLKLRRVASSDKIISTDPSKPAASLPSAKTDGSSGWFGCCATRPAVK